MLRHSVVRTLCCSKLQCRWLRRFCAQTLRRSDALRSCSPAESRGCGARALLGSARLYLASGVQEYRPRQPKGPADALALFWSAKDDVGERQTSCKRTTLGVVQLVSTFLSVSYTTLVALNSQGRLAVRTKNKESTVLIIIVMSLSDSTLTFLHLDHSLAPLCLGRWVRGYGWARGLEVWDGRGRVRG